MRQRRLCVEFLGMPGSGKSTLSHTVAKVLRRHGVTVAEPTFATDHVLSECRRYLYKSRRVAGEVLRRPAFAANALRIVARSRQRSRTETVLAAVNWLFITSLLERPPQAAAVQLVDEGVFQALWSVCLEACVGEPAELLSALARAAPCPDAVVMLDVGTAEIQRRLQRRPDGMSRMDSACRDADMWYRARRALHETRKVLDALAASTGRPLVLRLRNDRPEDPPRQAEWLAALILSARHGELRLVPELEWPWASPSHPGWSDFPDRG